LATSGSDQGPSPKNHLACRPLDQAQAPFNLIIMENTPMSTEQIRMLNDDLRKHLLGCGAVITTGIAALGSDAVARLVQTIAVFDDFCHASDSREEHDFGCFKFDDVDVIFKIDYYDKSLNVRSSNYADPAATERVISIMRADEY
jgi:hypothetical protein